MQSCKGNLLDKNKAMPMKALIILDNDDQVEQLEKLVVNSGWLCAGSRIIIISIDKHILREHGVDEVYNAQLLNNDAL